MKYTERADTNQGFIGIQQLKALMSPNEGRKGLTWKVNTNHRGPVRKSVYLLRGGTSILNFKSQLLFLSGAEKWDSEMKLK